MLSKLSERLLDRYVRTPTLDSVDLITSALAPRMLLTFGIVPLPGSSGYQTIAIDDPRREGDGSSRTVDQFFRSKIRFNTVIGRKRRPAYFDLAIIGPDYRLGERRQILSLLKATAHRRSVVLLLRRATRTPRRSLRDGARGVADAFEGLELVPVIAGAPAILIGNLDLAVPLKPRARKRLPLKYSRRSRKDFIARHRIERVDLLIPPIAAPDAPSGSSRIIHPPYDEIGRSKQLLSRPVGSNQRSLGRWWGKDLALLPVNLRRFSDGVFLPVNGQTEGGLFASDGAPVASSFLWELGYGPDLSEATLENPPTCVRGPKGRWYPIQNAGSLRSGRRKQGDFYHLGLLDSRFGHFLVENLPRAWALDWALERGMRILVWGEVKPFHRSALALLGVGEDRIEIAEPGMAYEHIYSPDAAFRMIGSVAPKAASVWRRLSEAAFQGSPRSMSPEPFLYLSRAGVRKRRLVNEMELEEVLRTRGGRILHPETLAFDAQIRAAASARAIVGCFGSQLHLSMFQPSGARKLVIAGEQFLGPDETLISIAAETNVSYYIEPVPRSRSAAARTAPWSVDLDRFARSFDEWLENAAGSSRNRDQAAAGIT